MAHARNTSNRLARTAILGGLHLPSLCVCAQEAGAAAAEVVHVSGTRITSPGASAGSPILSVNADELRAAQAVAVEEFFKDLPGAAPASGPASNLGSIGGATIDLRGLGANRTLVLIDGRRLVPFNLGGTVDTNTIPLALLSRVDVLTGGASAVYGADAVAGVANFRLRRRVQGVELFTSYGKSSSGDTVRQRTGVTAGTSWNQGRGNIVFTVDKTKTSPLFQGERSFGASSLDSVNAQPAGSGTTAPPPWSASLGAPAAAMRWRATGSSIQPAAHSSSRWFFTTSIRSIITSQACGAHSRPCWPTILSASKPSYTSISSTLVAPSAPRWRKRERRSMSTTSPSATRSYRSRCGSKSARGAAFPQRFA